MMVLDRAAAAAAPCVPLVKHSCAQAATNYWLTAGGCKPGVEVVRKDTGKFPAVQRWDAGLKMGQHVAYEVGQGCL